MSKKIFPLVLILLLTIWSFQGGAQEKAVTTLCIPAGKLTPGFLNSNTGGNIVSAVYDYLFRLDENGEVYPSLVKSYETSQDNKVWTMRLPKGAKFHDGTDLTAKDVVFTFQRLTNKELGTALLSVFGPLIEKVEAVDKYTVKFTLSRSDAAFHKKLTEYNTAIVSSEYNYQKYGDTRPMGSGAFQVVKVVPQERVVLKANPNYWLKGVPSIDKLTFLMIPEKETAIKMLEAGQGDIITDINTDQYTRLQRSPNFQLYKTKVVSPVIIDMNTTKPPFDDPRVRKALAYTIDRQELVESAVYGLGSPGNDTPFPPFHKYYDNLGGIRQRDIQKAKKLLAEAGYSDGLDVTLYSGSNIPPVLSVVLTIQEMARDAGINIELHTLPRDLYYAKYWLRVNLSATLWGHREDITQLITLAFACDASWNASHYCNKELDSLIAKASATTDPEKKQKYFSKIQQIFHEEVPSIIPIFKRYMGASTKRVKGFYVTQNWINEYRFIKVKE